MLARRFALGSTYWNLPASIALLTITSPPSIEKSRHVPPRLVRPHPPPSIFPTHPSLLPPNTPNAVQPPHARSPLAPGSVNPSGAAFYDARGADPSAVADEARGAPWARPDWPPVENGEMIAALDGDWDAVPDPGALAGKIKGKAAPQGGIRAAALRGAVLESMRPRRHIPPFRPSGPPGDRRDRASAFGNEVPRVSADVTLATTPFLVPGLPVRDVRLAPEADGLARRAGGSGVVTQVLGDGGFIDREVVARRGSVPGRAGAWEARDVRRRRPRSGGV